MNRKELQQKLSEKKFDKEIDTLNNFYFENQYIKSLLDVVRNGEESNNDRTGTGTIRLTTGYRFVFSNCVIPLLRGKLVNPWNALTEVIWILLGRNDLAWLKTNGVNYWDQWVKPDGTFGNIYGPMMRNQSGFDQLVYVINKLNSSKESRQALINLWHGADLENQALPPCFTEGKHYVSCLNGEYKLIENVNIGDFVLTDDGSYQKVLNTMKTQFNGKIKKIKHKLSNNEIESTLNHPFLIERKSNFNTDNKFKNKYINSEDIIKGDYFNLSKLNIEKINSLDFEYEVKIKGDKFKIKKESIIKPEEYYLMGYYLGNGWTENKIENKECKHKYFVSIPDFKRKEILNKINKCASLGIANNSGENVKKFQGANIKWWTILNNFGSGALNKFIPDFIFQLNDELILQFLKGYFDADGCNTKTYEFTSTTISPNIAYGIQKLFSKLNRQCIVTKTLKPEKTIILGREVNQNHVYAISVAYENNENTFLIDENNKVLIEDINEIDYNGFVYNLSVENNPTYTVNNIITHNCHFLYHPLIVNDKLHLHCGQRSSDSFLGVPYDYMLFYFIQEILCYWTDTIPGNIIHTNNDYHIYQNHYSAIYKYMENYLANPEQKITNPNFHSIEIKLQFPDKSLYLNHTGEITSSGMTLWLEEFYKLNKQFESNYNDKKLRYGLIKADVSV